MIVKQLPYLCKKQETELKATHNFGGGEGWFSGKVNN